MPKNVTVEIAEYRSQSAKGATIETPYSVDRVGPKVDQKLNLGELADLNLKRSDFPGAHAGNVLDKFDTNGNGVLDKADITKLVQAVDKKNHAAFEKICPKGTVKLGTLIELAENLNITARDLSKLSPSAAPNVTVVNKGDQVIR